MDRYNAQKSYDKLGVRYDWLTRLADLMALNHVKRQIITQHAYGHVLEVGSGTGKNFSFYSTNCADITGVDLSDKSLQVAKKKAQKSGLKFTPVCVDATTLPFPDHSFDTVVMTLVACTLQDPKKVFEEMKRVCTVNGKVLFVEHTPPTTWDTKLLIKAVAPLARKFLSCNPYSNNLSLLGQSGLTQIDQVTAVKGILQGIICLS